MLHLERLRGWFLSQPDDLEWRWLIMFLLRRAKDQRRTIEERRFFLERVESQFAGWKNGKSFFRVVRLAKKIKSLRKELDKK